MSKYACMALALLLAAAMGCSPDSELSSVEAADTVVTLFSDQADFPNAFTFTMADTVMHLVGEGGTDDITRIYDDLILSRVRDDMLAQGWTEIASPDSTHRPDVALNVGVTTSDYVAYSYWPPYWGYYPGWGYPGYGWGWGYYPAYTYTTGSVLMAMLDLRNPNAETQTLPVMWFGAVNGIASTTASNQSRIVNGIDQAFEQSPYLRK
jgi:hypothetical protein